MQRSRVRYAVAGGIAALAIGGFAVANAANDRPSQQASPQPTSTPSATGQLPDGSTRNYVAGTAGSVEITRNGDSISVTRTLPNLGWVVEVERSSGDEVEVEFTNGGSEIDFNAELEDGQLRVRVSDDDVTTTTGPNGSAPGTTPGSTPVTAPDGTSPSTTPNSTPTTAPDDFDDDDGIDNSGPGSVNSGHDDDDDDDNSGPGGGDDDNSGHGDDDDDSSGHGGGDDDKSGHGGDDD